MSGWLRLDADYATDGRLRKCRAVSWWPLILCALKRGGGVASDDDLDPQVLADIGQGDASEAGAAVDRLRACGLLVATPGGWTTPRWSEYQPDPTTSARSRAYRERNRLAAEAAASRFVTVTRRDETVRHGDVTAENGSSRLTGHDDTGRHSISVGATTSRVPADAPAHARTHARAELPGVSKTVADLEQLAIAVRAIGRGGPGLVLDSGSAHLLAELAGRYTVERCDAVLRAECIGAERPVAMLRARLGRTTDRPRAIGPTAAMAEWEVPDDDA